MLLDAALAWVHFVFLFMLLSTLGGEAFVLRLPMTPQAVALLPTIDRAYEMSAIGLVLAGIARVMWGAKGGAYYSAEPFFWAKMATFLVIAFFAFRARGVFKAWKNAILADAGFLPEAAAVKRAQGLVLMQLRLLGLVAVFAVLMARGIGLS